MDAILPPSARPPKPKFLVYDNLMDRREILLLLRRMEPRRRMVFYRWACAAATLPNSPHRAQVTPETTELAKKARWCSKASEMLCNEIYSDMFYLSWMYNFDLDRAVAKLVEMVRKPDSRY